MSGRAKIASFVEGLENRKLFAYSFTTSAGVVTATGDSSSDTLTITQSGSTVTFTQSGGFTTNFTSPVGIVVNANGGNDVVTADLSLSSSIDFTANGGTGADTIVGGNGGDALIGGDGNDDVEGRGGNDTLNGGLNNDTILGGNGNDTIYGAEGDDNLRGDSGADDVRGDTGTDRVDEGSTSAVVVTLNNVADDGASSGAEGDNIRTGAELIQTTNYNDQIDASFVSYSVTLIGGGGNDTISGGSATDFLDGGSGTADSLVGSPGGDTTINFELP